MKRIALALAVKAAKRDVAIGLAAALAVTSARLLVFIAFLIRSPSPIGILGAGLLVELLLVAVCTFGIYRRRDGAAAFLLVLYALRIGFLWYISGRVWPPVTLLTLLVAYGLYRGVRGTTDLATMPTAAVPAALANER